MSNGSREELKQRIRRDVVQYAIFRPESAIVIALTLFLTFLSALIANIGGDPGFTIPWWSWLILGGGALSEAVLIYASMTDPVVSKKIVEAMFREKFKPEQISDKELQKQINEALDYRGLITEIIEERADTVLTGSLEETVTQIDEWIKDIYNLAKRLDDYRGEKGVIDRNIQRADRKSVV